MNLSEANEAAQFRTIRCQWAGVLRDARMSRVIEISMPRSDDISSQLLLIRLFQQATSGSVGDGAPVVSEDSTRIPGEVR